MKCSANAKDQKFINMWDIAVSMKELREATSYLNNLPVPSSFAIILCASVYEVLSFTGFKLNRKIFWCALAVTSGTIISTLNLQVNNKINLLKQKEQFLLFNMQSKQTKISFKLHSQQSTK